MGLDVSFLLCVVNVDRSDINSCNPSIPFIGTRTCVKHMRVKNGWAAMCITYSLSPGLNQLERLRIEVRRVWVLDSLGLFPPYFFSVHRHCLDCILFFMCCRVCMLSVPFCLFLLSRFVCLSSLCIYYIVSLSTPFESLIASHSCHVPSFHR